MPSATIITLLLLAHAHVLALATEQSCSPNASPGSAQLQKLNLLTMLPFPDPDPQFDPSWNEGLKVLPALYLARDQINSRMDLLPCRQLELVVAGGGCDIAATTAVSLTVGLVGRQSNTRVVGMIGPGCSTSTLQTAPLLNQPEIQLVQLHGGGSPLLANRSVYNNSLSILGSTKAFVDLSIALMGKSGWKNIAILFESNRVYYSSTKEAFIASLNDDINVLFNSAVYDSFYPLDGVRSSLARVVFVFTAPSHSSKIMCLAYHMGMVYPAYQWVLISRTLSDFFGDEYSLSDSISFSYGGRVYSCTYREMLDIALEGTFLINYQLISARYDSQRLANTTFDTFLELYEDRTNQHNVTRTPWAYYFYDAVWAWARVLHRIMNKHGEVFDDFDYGNKTLANWILEEFYAPEFEFEGMSGLISFNSSSGFYNRPADLHQIVSSEERYVAYNNGTRIVKLQSLIIIPDLVRSAGKISNILIAVFVIIQFVELVVIIILHVLTVVYRNEKTVKASSPKLVHLAFVGNYILLFGLMLNLFIEIELQSSEVSGIVCQATWGWIFPIGFTLTIGTVTVRSWRIYRIFAHYLDPGKFISNTALIVMIAILLCIDLIIAILWTAVDPLTLVVVESSVQVGPARELVLNRSCRSQYGWQGYASWLVIVMSIRISLLVVMVTLSLLTRRIPNKTFATTSLRIFAYTFSCVFFLGFLLYYFFVFFNLNSNIDYAVLFMALNTCIILYMACIFMPPLMPVLKDKLKTLHENSQWLTLSVGYTTNKNTENPHRKASTAMLL